MNADINTIRFAGGKETPDNTLLLLGVGSLPGTASVSLKLPGQKDFLILKDLPIVNGILELPVQLLFLSYAQEDHAKVHEIGDRLWNDGFLTWFDKKDLKPGDYWQNQIKEGIEKADFVLAFLSRKSVSKRGYVQKELRYILQEKNKRPLGQKFIVPIRLEPCDVPTQFANIQWLDYWEDGAYEKLKSTFTSR